MKPLFIGQGCEGTIEDMKKGLLSVIIPTYKRNIEIVKTAIESVLIQDYPHIDVYVIDDNQNDSSYCDAIKKYCSNCENVHYVKQDGNKGACKARNLGISLSQGEYIGFLDDDDTWEPIKARMQIEKLKDTIGMAYCKGRRIDTNYSPPVVKTYYNSRFYKDKITFSDLMIRDCIGTTSQVIVHRKCFEKCGGFDETLLARQDYEMWLRISKHFDILGVDEILFNHYIHKGEQITKNYSKSLQGYTRIYYLYKKDFKNNRRGKNNIVCNIIKLAKRSKNYNRLIKFALIYFFDNPLCIIKIPYGKIKKIINNRGEK